MKVFSKDMFVLDLFNRGINAIGRESLRKGGWVNDCDKQIVTNNMCHGYWIDDDWCQNTENEEERNE